MRHLVGFLAISASLAFGGCGVDPSTFGGSIGSVAANVGTAIVTAGGKAVVAEVQKISDDPAQAFCVANTANRLLRPVLSGKSALGSNRKAARITRRNCPDAGGKVTPASQVTPVASAT